MKSLPVIFIRRVDKIILTLFKKGEAVLTLQGLINFWRKQVLGRIEITLHERVRTMVLAMGALAARTHLHACITSSGDSVLAAHQRYGQTKLLWPTHLVHQFMTKPDCSHRSKWQFLYHSMWKYLCQFCGKHSNRDVSLQNFRILIAMTMLQLYWPKYDVICGLTEILFNNLFIFIWEPSLQINCF